MIPVINEYLIPITTSNNQWITAAWTSYNINVVWPWVNMCYLHVHVIVIQVWGWLDGVIVEHPCTHCLLYFCMCSSGMYFCSLWGCKLCTNAHSNLSFLPLSSLVEAINTAAEAWGINCMRYEIKDIMLPTKVREAMQMQVRSLVQALYV